MDERGTSMRINKNLLSDPVTLEKIHPFGIWAPPLTPLHEGNEQQNLYWGLSNPEGPLLVNTLYNNALLTF